MGFNPKSAESSLFSEFGESKFLRCANFFLNAAAINEAGSPATTCGSHFLLLKGVPPGDLKYLLNHYRDLKLIIKQQTDLVLWSVIRERFIEVKVAIDRAPPPPDFLQKIIYIKY